MNVPKKINRHVLKALNILCDGNVRKSIPIEDVINQVEYQMRNLVPVANLETTIKQALDNLSEVGLILKKNENSFAIGHSFGEKVGGGGPRTNISPLHRKYFEPRVARKRSSRNLDPNSHPNRHKNSQESISGDEYDRARKRLRTNNKKFRFGGGKVDLPKSKNHHHSRQREDIQGYLSDGDDIMDHSFNFSEWLSTNPTPLLIMTTNSAQQQPQQSFMPCAYFPTLPASVEITEIPTDETETTKTMQRGRNVQRKKEIKLQCLGEGEKVEADQPSTSQQQQENDSSKLKLPQKEEIDENKKSQQTLTKQSTTEINSNTPSRQQQQSEINITKNDVVNHKSVSVSSTSNNADMETILAPRSMSYLN